MDNEAIQKAHDDGFRSGLNWPETWMAHGKPGGPFVTSAGYDEKSRAMHAQLSAERTAWCKGWEEGLAEKIATGRVNPLSDPEKNAAYHQTKI
jgi:hypothetical protein